MLFYSDDISRTEARQITYRITKAVRKQNPDMLIEVESRIPTDAFAVLQALLGDIDEVAPDISDIDILNIPEDEEF